MEDNEDDDDDEEAADECVKQVYEKGVSLIFYRYSDDEDTSYKVRRSATKLLSAVIGTRPELLSQIYVNVSPVLISRFGDREETVRTEVWATYMGLLQQTSIYGGEKETEAVAVAGSKRKRDDEEEEETGGDDSSPLGLLRAQVGSLCKVLLKQLQGKSSPTTAQAGFQLLIELIKVLPGALTQHASNAILTARGVLQQSVASATASLHISALSFLTIFFKNHPYSSFSSSVPSITPTLLNALAQSHPRVAAEAFKVFSALLQSTKPSPSADWVIQVHDEAVKRLTRNDTDAEVRAGAEEVIGDLWISANETVSSRGSTEWEALRKGARPEGAVNVTARVAASGVPVSNEWIVQSIEWVLNVLRRSSRGGRVESFKCLDVLLNR